MVTLALFDTLLGLNNEQMMVELLLKYLRGAPHVPAAQKHKINKIQSYAKTVDYFIELAPDVMKNSNKIIAEHNSMDYQHPSSLPPSTNVSKTIGANWNHFSTISGSGETLYSNYHAYLYDSHQKVKQKKRACDRWSENYFFKGTSKENQSQIPNEKIKQLIASFLADFNVEPLIVNEPHSHLTSKQLDSLQSIGESSGYESLKYRPDEDDEMSDISHQKSTDSGCSNMTSGSNTTKTVEPWKICRAREEKMAEIDLNESFSAQGTVSLGKTIKGILVSRIIRVDNSTGPFLTAIWSKLQTYTSNLLYVNLHLTGIISHMSTYPLPLLHSIFLRPDIATASDLPSFHQVLKIMKQQIDAELPMTEESLEFIDNGRTFLIDREFRLINARKIALETLKSNKNAPPVSGTSQLLSYDPFNRTDATRRSTGNSFMKMFRRPSTASTSSQASNAQGKS